MLNVRKTKQYDDYYLSFEELGYPPSLVLAHKNGLNLRWFNKHNLMYDEYIHDAFHKTLEEWISRNFGVDIDDFDYDWDYTNTLDANPSNLEFFVGVVISTVTEVSEKITKVS